MNRSKRLLAIVLSALMVLGALPVTSLAVSTEIWPGYPGVDQLPAVDNIPDPFKFFDVKNDPNGDGYVSSPAEWTARRNEIKDLVQHYWLGYRWPTKAADVVGEYNKDVEIANFADVWGTKIYLRTEFDKLVTKLLSGTVTVSGTTYGPAANASEAESMAIAAWNAGYSVTIKLFGFWDYAVKLKDYTGTITAAPNPTKIVKRNVITVTNPDTSAKASYFINVTTPSSAQMVLNWGSEDAQAPVVIDIGGTISSTQTEVLKQKGYGLITFTATDVYPDDSSADNGIDRNGVYTTLYPYNKDVYEYASGAEMAWGWGVSQIISALEQTTPDNGGTQTFGKEIGLDPAKTLVTGHSRYGKAALFAAAFDDRIRICLASEPGGSGIQSYRYRVEGKIFNFNTYPKADRVYGRTEIPTVSYGNGSSWFPETAANFVTKDNQIPFDSSDIISLVAPRPFLATTGIDAHWLGNEGAVAAVEAASEVYAYVGSNAEEKNNAAVRARESNHALYNRDMPFVISMMDREFKQTSSDNTLHVQDLFTTPASANWDISYPAKDYNNISEFNSYPFDINSSYLPWSRPDKYTLWTAQENFLVGHPVTITAHSDAPDVKLYLPDKTTEVTASSHDGETFTYNLTAEQTVYGRYELRTAGGAKENRSVYFAAVSLADSLRHATSKGDEGEENRLIGFSSRLANSKDDAPEVWVNGKLRTMSFATGRFKPEETTLMNYGINFHDKLFADIANNGWDSSKTFDIKNLKFVTIPGFTFEVSFGNVPASAGNSGKDLASNFTQPISWNVEKFNNGPAAVWPEIPDNQTEKNTVLAGGTVTRPTSPNPKATAYNAKIVDTSVLHVGNKTNVVLRFDQVMDTREFGFGFNVTDAWDTTWSEDKKQVALSMSNNKFPDNTSGDLIIFRLKDASGNMIPGPAYLSLTNDPNYAPVDAAVTSIQGGTYDIPVASQSNQAAKTAWVQTKVNERIPSGNGSTATVTYDNGYKVSVTKGSITKSATIAVTECDSSLSNLSISAGALNPAFTSVTTSYSISVANSVTSLTVTPVAKSANATITVNGKAVTSGQTSQAISLAVLNNTISIVVTASDGTSKQYVVTANRAEAYTGGGSDTSSSNPTPAPSPSPTPTPAPSPAPTPAPAPVVTINPTLNGSTGVIKLDDSKAKELLSKDTTITVPEIAGAKDYSVGIPSAVLSSGKGDGSLTVSTKAGKITIPDNMLAGISGVAGKETAITISQANKAELPADVKAALGNRPVIQLTLSADGKQTEWNNPSAPVTISIPYKPTADELKNPDNIVVWYIDGSGKAVTVPSGRYDAKTGSVIFETTHFSQYAVAYVQKNFSDLGKTAWAEKSIKALAAKEILKTSGNAFQPRVNITRADFLYSLVRALGVSAKTNGNFDDISKSAYYYNEIAVAKALGITTGLGNNKFGPDSSITRQDMMVMTEKALKLLKKVNQQGSATVLDKFTDKSVIASYAKNSVATIVKEGLITGSNNRINPAGNTSRAEAAVFLYRIYSKY